MQINIEKIAQAKMTRSRWVFWCPPHSHGRERDIFGVFDALVMRPEGILFLQFTSKAHITDREKKISAFFKAKKVRLPPGTAAEVWGWDQTTKKFTIRQC
jgi:hypothetical protein